MPEIQMPKLSDTMTEGTLVSWKKKKGDKVSAGEVIAEIETDKATMEWESPEDGTLGEIYVEEGGKVNVGDKIAFIGGEGEEAPKKDEKPKAEPKEKPAKSEKKAVEAGVSPAQEQPGRLPPQTTDEEARVKASPVARRVAAELGVDLGSVKGTGPDGRVTETDVRAAAKSKGGAPQKAPAAAKPSAQSIKAGEGADTAKITVNDFVLKAAVQAAVKVPRVNASFDGDAIVQYADVDLGIAVAIEDGLLTPVIRAAQNKSLRDISERVKDLAHRARNKRMKPEEFQGGSFTVSNLGGMGIDSFFAVINPPQGFILSIGAIVKTAVVDDSDRIIVGHRMSIGMSCDHRVIDGALGAEYLKELRQLLENPALLLV